MTKAQEILQTADRNAIEAAVAVANSETSGVAFAYGDRSFLYTDGLGEWAEWTVEQFLSLARHEHPQAKSTAGLAVCWDADPECDVELAASTVAVEEFCNWDIEHGWYLFADDSALLITTGGVAAKTKADFTLARVAWRES